MQRRLAAILAADVVGYSRLMGADEERTHAAFRRCHEIVTGLVTKHGGRIFGGAGDSVMAEFASPIEAVRGAIEIQNEVSAMTLDLPEGCQMKFRIGINIGDVMVDRGELFGDGINIAARLQALADPGGICISANIHEHVVQKLALQYQDIGEQTVKNIAKPVHVYRVRVREAAEHLLSITTSETFANNWLVARLGKFQLAHPNFTVRFAATRRMVDFTYEEFDVGIRGGGGCWPNLKAHMLLPVEFTPLCSPEFLNRAGNLTGPADLLRLPLLDWADDWWRRWFELAGIADPKPPPHPDIQCDVQAMLGVAAMAGQGVAILMPAFFAAELATGRLVQPFDLVARSELSYWLVYSEDRQNSPKIVAFREWILQEIARDLERLTSANQP